MSGAEPEMNRGPLRILHLILHLDYGGAERKLACLGPELVRRGHEVHVGYFYDGIHRADLAGGGVRLHSLRPLHHRNPLCLLRLYRLCREVRPDVVQTWLTQMDVWGGLAARAAGIPWLLTEVSVPSAYTGLETRLLHWANRARAVLARGTAAIVSNSAGGDAYWRRRYPGKTTFVVPNGVPLEEIARAPAHVPAELALDASQQLVLAVGRLTMEKNVAALVQALVRAFRAGGAQALICGDGPLRRELEKDVRVAGLTDRIHFPGFIPERLLWGLMKRADVLVSASRVEGRPNAVIEAMACGSPLVVSDIPAHREFLDERCARFVDPIEPASIAAGIEAVLADPAAARVRAGVARAIVGQWSIPAFVDGYEDVYRRVLAGRHPERPDPIQG